MILKRVGGDESEIIFCKTAHRPYDLMVCSCLLLYRAHFPKQVKVRSLGDLEDWMEAIQFVSDYVPKYKESLTLKVMENKMFDSFDT